MKEAIKGFVRTYEVCQKNKHESISPPALLDPLPMPTQVWEDVSMDFIEGLPPSNSRTAIMVVVDHFSKYAHFIALRHPTTTTQLAQIFFDN